MKKVILKNVVLIVALVSFSTSCQGSTSENNKTSPSATTIEIDSNMVTAYFASGCFWCVEAIYEHTKGVGEVISGYSGGHTKNPTYESSNTGKTGHAEAVKVFYDPSIISFSQLIDIYFATQNPTQVNGQGPDHGSSIVR